MKIAIFNRKGGVGKTTTAVHLARVWADEFGPTLLDMTSQAHVFNVADALGKCQLQNVPPDQLHAHLQRMEQRRITLFDCPPTLEAARAVLLEADALLVPVQTEFLAYQDAIRFNASLRRLEGDWSNRIRFVLTMFNPRNHRELREAARSEWGESLCHTVIYRASVFEDAAQQGVTVLDCAPESRAARQYANLAKEINQWLRIH